MTTTANWFYWALLSAAFAALTAIFAKIGIRGVDSDLATLVRTAVVFVALSAFVWFAGKWSNPFQLSGRTWLFLTLSGLATGASWVCYVRALQVGEASKVAPIDKLSLVLVAIFAVVFLDERPSLREWTGIAMVAGGVLVLGGLVAAGGVLLLLSDPALAIGFRTLERLLGQGIEASARPALWAAALSLAGEAMPWGVGTGGFTVAAGFGEWRGLYPHNHAIEALAEGGLPGLLLWLGAFGGGVVVLVARLARLGPGRASRLVALTLPMAVAALVSTDLGNRMVWFALGLALSAAVTAEPRDG
jgi:transporter family protein